MPITSVSYDRQQPAMTVTADFPVPVARLWDAHLDPRLIERFWGPPEWPATFTRHDARPGGVSHYRMTGPGGETSRGRWDWLALEPRSGFTVQDSFARDDGTPNTDMPRMRMATRFQATPAGSRITTVTTFDTPADLDKLLDMGMEDGMRAAMGQMDAILADSDAFTATAHVVAQTLTDTTVRISRVVHGGIDEVWRAYNDPDLVPRWMTGPDGWTMPVCRIATEPGQAYRFEWAHADSGETFGFTGMLRETAPPYRAVSTETMIGSPTPETINELTLTATSVGTLVTVVITYPDKATRDAILATGMTDGMETSYRRLETLLAVTVAQP